MGGLSQSSPQNDQEQSQFSTSTEDSRSECIITTIEVGHPTAIQTATPGTRKEKIRSEISVIEIQEEQDERVSLKRNSYRSNVFAFLCYTQTPGHFDNLRNAPRISFGHPYALSSLNRPHILLQVFRI